MPAKSRGSVFKAGDGFSGSAGRKLDGARRRPASRRRPLRATGSARTCSRASGAAPPDITLAFCDLYLQRHAANVLPATIVTLRERLRAPIAAFGDWKLRDLEGAADDFAAWAARQPTPNARWVAMRTLARSSRPRSAGATSSATPPCTPARTRSRAPRSCARSPRSTSTPSSSSSGCCMGRWWPSPPRRAAHDEWLGLERRDIDRTGTRPAVLVQRRVRGCQVRPYPRRSAARPAQRPGAAGGREPPAAPGHAAAVPRRDGRTHRPRQLAHTRLVPGAGRRRCPAARPVPPPPHLRDGGAGRGHVDLPAPPA